MQIQADQILRLATFLRGLASLASNPRNTKRPIHYKIEYTHLLTHMCPDGVQPYSDIVEEESRIVGEKNIQFIHLVPFCRNGGLTFDFIEAVLYDLVIGNDGPINISICDLWQLRFMDRDSDDELGQISACFYDDLYSDEINMDKFNSIAGTLHNILTVC